MVAQARHHFKIDLRRQKQCQIILILNWKFMAQARHHFKIKNDMT